MRHVVERSQISEPVFLILSSLAAAPQHGYAILKEVETLSAGRVRLSTGTLYGALRRLLEERSIRRFAEKDATRDRQLYELTPSGRQLLAAEVDRMRTLARLAAARLVETEA